MIQLQENIPKEGQKEAPYFIRPFWLPTEGGKKNT